MIFAVATTLAALVGPARAAATDPALDAAVDALLAEHVQADGPGAVVGVLKDGAWICRRSLGLADVAARTPLTITTPVYIASTAKQFTAACVLLLARTKKLTLDAKIGTLVDGLPPWGSRVTVRDLVHHRSGIADAYDVALLADLPPERRGNAEAILALIRAQQELDFEPGAEFAYSNSNYVLLGEIVRRVSGETLAEFAQQNLFAPLGMAHTKFAASTDEVPEGAAVGHVLRDGAYATAPKMPHIVGPGALWTTLEDLRLWNENFLTGRVGGKDFGASMISIPDIGTRGSWRPDLGPYAAGLFVGSFRGATTVSHRGGAFGFRSEMVRFPEHGVTVVCVGVAEDFDAPGIARAIAAVVLGEALADEPERAPPTPAAQALFGLWIDATSGTAWGIGARGAEMRASTIGVHVPVVPTADGALVGFATQVPVRFEATADDALRVTIGEAASVTYARARKPGPSALDAAACAGSYRSDALDVTIELASDGERLALVQQDGALARLEPFAQVIDGVWLGGLPNVVGLRFERGADGAVVAATFSAAGARRVRFERR
jgi:CubicO group peptidase (beta-lactamase class C family)